MRLRSIITEYLADFSYAKDRPYKRPDGVIDPFGIAADELMERFREEGYALTAEAERQRAADHVLVRVSTLREIRRAIECSTVLAAPRLLGIVDDVLSRTTDYQTADGDNPTLPALNLANVQTLRRIASLIVAPADYQRKELRRIADKIETIIAGTPEGA